MHAGSLAAIHTLRSNDRLAGRVTHVPRPDGRRTRKYVYGPDRSTVDEQWIALHAEAKEGPVATKVPTWRTGSPRSSHPTSHRQPL